MKAIREAPAIAAYLLRLEDHWHELWLRYRGTELLPDSDHLSLKFDLVAHIEFLRRHIDKNALFVFLFLGYYMIVDGATDVSGLRRRKRKRRTSFLCRLKGS
jgi:hypothetical protein